MFSIRPIFLLLFFIFIAITSTPANATLQQQLSKPQTLQPETTAGLQAFFQNLDYSWTELDDGVPPFILERIPADIGRAKSTKTKKHTFFMGLLPMVLLANQEIKAERQEILQIFARNAARASEADDQDKIELISKRYGLRGRPLVDHRVRTQLLNRVDIIPPALVLAQAANESAWGTSRFSRLGNNLFGEWTFKPGTGIVPAGRPEGATYEVRKFSSLYASIRSYMNNLNRNGAYRLLRKIREDLRKQDKPVTGMALARGLLRYSQRGEEYIQEIQSMIRQNDLARINGTFLRQPETEVLTSISTTGSGLFSSRNRIIGHRSDTRQNP
jgi:Bax protein